MMQVIVFGSLWNNGFYNQCDCNETHLYVSCTY